MSLCIPKVSDVSKGIERDQCHEMGWFRRIFKTFRWRGYYGLEQCECFCKTDLTNEEFIS